MNRVMRAPFTSRARGAVAAGGAPEAPRGLSLRIPSWRPSGVPARSLAVFTRQFATMMDAGVPLVQCLGVLGEQEKGPRLRGAILAVRAEVEGGSGLADAMRRHPDAFDGLYTNMIAAGESGGILDTILKRLAACIETNVKLRRQVRSALTYPVAVVAIAAAVVGVILWKVIPTFAVLFEGVGATLPLPTRLVIAASDSLVALLPAIAAAGLGGSAALRWFRTTRRGRRLGDAAMLRAPVVGAILRKIAVARFCRTLSALFGSGVPILEGLAITAGTAGNAVVEEAVMTTRAAVERGESMSGPMRATGVFPVSVVHMIDVGETTGALDAMLAKVADICEEDVDAAVAGLMTLLEPILIALLGVVVGGIVVAMYLPIFDLIGELAR
ncbi:MAG: type II secretion system F family protein [Acidobacteria bacterium]|nr:type II secretion system F family protein [Acidobacteriota bacterium]